MVAVAQLVEFLFVEEAVGSSILLGHQITKALVLQGFLGILLYLKSKTPRDWGLVCSADNS